MSFKLIGAASKDTGYILNLATVGAINGHFDTKVLTETEVFRAYINSAITKGADLKGFQTEALLAYADETLVGAVVITDAIGTPDKGVELALIAIDVTYHGHGYGSSALDALLKHFLPQGSVYARCLPASERLRQMLVKRGFAHVGKLGQSAIFRHGRSDGRDQPAGGLRACSEHLK